MQDDRPRDFGSKLRELRLAAELSQEALAERARLSVQAIGALERGDRKVPYQDTIARLAGALHLTPEQQRDLADAAGSRRGLPRRTAARAAPVSGTVPEPETQLIGRDDDVIQLGELLRRRDVRFITLTGAGGIGKTRLALRIASAFAKEYQHGACAVSLAHIRDSANVDAEILLALGLTLRGAMTARDALCSYLKTRELLLVLDNFEHVLAAAPTIVEVLVRCPSVKVVVTSREPLRVAGEHEYAVSALLLPSAVELFVERAHAVNPKFSIVPKNAGAVEHVCRQLDGLPLALELAAPLTRLASPARLVEWMKLRLDVAIVGSRDIQERHRTMRNAIAWSYDLLDESERRLFRRLSIFVGGCDIDAARRVCKSVETDAQACASLSSLVDKNLLQAWEVDSLERRTGMLETIRQFARERLTESGEALEIGRRHVDHFLSLSVEANAGMQGADEGNWCEQLDIEIGNLRAAMQWTRDRGALDAGLRIAVNLVPYWERRGFIVEGRRWLDGFLALAAPVTLPRPSLAIVEALLGAGVLASHQDDYEAAQEHFVRALDDSRDLGYRPGVARAKTRLGVIAHARGDCARAVSLLEESLDLWREIGDPSRVAGSLNALALAVRDRGDLDASVTLFEQSLGGVRSIGTPSFIAQVLANMGETEHMRGANERAALLLNESLTLLRQLGHRWSSGITLARLGDVACATGDLERAKQCYRESLSINRSIGVPQNIALSLEGLGRVASACGDPRQAVRLWSAAAAEREAIGLHMIPTARAALDETLRLARATLGDSEFEAAWLEGTVRPLDELVNADPYSGRPNGTRYARPQRE